MGNRRLLLLFSAVFLSFLQDFIIRTLNFSQNPITVGSAIRSRLKRGKTPRFNLLRLITEFTPLLWGVFGGIRQALP